MGEDKTVAAFCENLLALEPALWTFAQVEDVEPTNNFMERLLRRAVLWRKRSFGSSSLDGCRFVERILTIVPTRRLQGKNALEFSCTPRCWLIAQANLVPNCCRKDERLPE